MAHGSHLAPLGGVTGRDFVRKKESRSKGEARDLTRRGGWGEMGAKMVCATT